MQRDARPQRAVGGADAAGVPPRGARARAGRARRGCSPQATDDAWLVERAGGRVIVVAASAENLKVTTPLDLRVAELLLAERERAPGAILLESRPRCSPTTTSTCAPTTPRRDRRGVLHAGQRRALPRGGRASGGSPSWASPSTSTASARRSRSGATRSGERYAHDDIDEYCAFVREQTDLRLGHRGRLRARRARTAWPTCSRRATSTTWSARCTSSARARSTWTTTACGTERGRSAEEIWRRYFETLAEAAAQRAVRHPRPPRPREVLGPRTRPHARGRPAPLLRARRSKRSPKRGSPSRSPPRGCASPPARSTRRRRSSRCAWKPARRWRSRATPTAPRTWARTTSRRSSCSTSSASSELCVFERRAPAPGADRGRRAVSAHRHRL